MKFSFNLVILFVSILLLTEACKKKTELNGHSKTIHFDGHTFDVYTATYPGADIKMYWKNKQGNKLRNFDNLKALVAAGGKKLVFATNAGMYMENNSPLGLYIENSIEKSHINLSNKGKGNFYLQPNGVFLLTEKTAAVVTSDSFKWLKDKCVYATQSGPMLVIKGEINKSFTKGSTNTNIRSGVGIDRNGYPVFAISDENINFYDFAVFFRDNLLCNNALFLDGSISKMYLPEIEREDLGGDFGVIIGVTDH